MLGGAFYDIQHPSETCEISMLPSKWYAYGRHVANSPEPHLSPKDWFSLIFNMKYIYIRRENVFFRLDCLRVFLHHIPVSFDVKEKTEEFMYITLELGVSNPSWAFPIPSFIRKRWVFQVICLTIPSHPLETRPNKMEAKKNASIRGTPLAMLETHRLGPKTW